MQIQRQSKRTEVEIPVTVTSVLESQDAFLVDLSEHGAQISGCGLPAGTRFQVEYMGQTLYAQVRWSEIDRMGVKFAYPLTDGPLYERLMVARAAQMPDEPATGTQYAYAPIQPRATSLAGRTFGRAPMHGGFGRRV